ncbi:MAG: hypothetical protein AAF653_19010, partial [Chloroflexota bacterium]
EVVEIQKRRQLGGSLKALQPVEYNELIEAADLLRKFGDYWDECETMTHPSEARQQLVSKIVDRVIVYDDRVAALVLHGD